MIGQLFAEWKDWTQNEIESIVQFQCVEFVSMCFTRLMHKSGTCTIIRSFVHWFDCVYFVSFVDFISIRSDDTCFFFIVVVVLFNGYGGCEFYLFFGWMASTHSDFQSTHKFACLNKFLRLHNGIGVSASASVTKIDYMPLIDSFRFYVIFRYVHDTLHSLCCLWYWMFSESRHEEKRTERKKKIICVQIFSCFIRRRRKKSRE